MVLFLQNSKTKLNNTLFKNDFKKQGTQIYRQSLPCGSRRERVRSKQIGRHKETGDGFSMSASHLLII